MPISEEKADRIIGERDRAENRLANIKSESMAVGEAGLGLGLGFGVGAGIGYFNARQGGTPTAPYLVGGKVALDLGVAIVGGIATLAMAMSKKDRKHLPAVSAAAGGAMGVLGYRYGTQWQANQAGTATTPTTTATPTTSGVSVGFGGRMAPRMAPRQQYGARQNPYVSRQPAHH